MCVGMCTSVCVGVGVCGCGCGCGCGCVYMNSSRVASIAPVGTVI